MFGARGTSADSVAGIAVFCFLWPDLPPHMHSGLGQVRDEM